MNCGETTPLLNVKTPACDLKSNGGIREGISHQLYVKHTTQIYW